MRAIPTTIAPLLVLFALTTTALRAQDDGATAEVPESLPTVDVAVDGDTTPPASADAPDSDAAAGGDTSGFRRAFVELGDFLRGSEEDDGTDTLDDGEGNDGKISSLRRDVLGSF